MIWEIVALAGPAWGALGVYCIRKMLTTADHLERVLQLEAQLAEQRRVTAEGVEALRRLLLCLPACVACHRRPATWDDGAWEDTGRAWCDDCIGTQSVYRAAPKRELPWRPAVRELRLSFRPELWPEQDPRLRPIRVPLIGPAKLSGGARRGWRVRRMGRDSVSR